MPDDASEPCEASELTASYRDDDSAARGQILVRWQSASRTSAAISADIEGALSESEVVPAGQTSFNFGTRLQDSEETDGDVRVTVRLELACGASLEQVFVFDDPVKRCAVVELDAIRGREADFYECVDRWLGHGQGCGPDGYPRGYGARYAQRFYEETRPRLSRQGEAWVDHTLVCLQARLRDSIALGTSCDQVREIAFGTHPGCYADSGFCALPIPDVINVAATIEPPDLLSEDGVRQLLGIVPECGAAYAAFLTGQPAMASNP
ncbi:MAG TPA: hypothetical protein VI299_26595 [Polyangiales bacterium]